MIDLQEMRNTMAKASSVVYLMNELYEVEDEYLETWLMEGCPDGASLSEIIAYIEDDDTYFEWIILANKLLEMRGQENG